MGVIGNAIRDIGMATADLGQGFGLGMAAGGHALGGNNEMAQKVAKEAF